MRWFVKAGGVKANGQRAVSGRYLSIQEREEISVGLAAELSMQEIARGLGRSASTVSREIARHPDFRGNYRAVLAQQQATESARRPKVARLVADPVLREQVQDGLTKKWSPEQISARLVLEYPDNLEMRVSHETIYQSIYVQGRGALKRELATCLRTGRALRKPRRRAAARRPRGPGRIADMVNIADRPAEADDRAVLGHWEGDLITGAGNRSAIGTVVERATRYVMLLHLPHRHDAVSVRDAIIKAIQAMPEQLRQTLTWDQGKELAHHREITIATDMAVYFCDPHSPWQRGTNENTNGLLRQYFPKGTDLSQHSATDLAAVAAQLNDRPRKTLAWRTPAETFHKLLFHS